MSGILKISEATTIALHAMVLMARFPGKVLSNSQMADILQVSEAHLSKVLQRLAREGLLKSSRGPRGGFHLRRKSDEITLLEVYEAVEGPVRLERCLMENPLCDKSRCILGNLMDSVNGKFLEHMSTKRLSDLTGVFDEAESLL
jgi:Rrf2 family protein